jgi:hypothetical protein
VGGTVYLADTGRPAEGAIVSLLPPQDRQGPVIDPKTGEFVVKDQPHRGDFHAVVQSDGSFQIEGVRPGSYYVLTYLPGYLSQDDYIYPGALSPERDPSAKQPAFVPRVEIVPGRVEHVILRLERGGQIEGTVRFSGGKSAQTGDGIAGGIALSLEIRSREGEFIRSGGAAHTDSDGHFHFEGLTAGSYVIFAALPGGTVTTKRGSMGSGGEIVFCCNTVRASKARIIEVRGTERQDQVDIEIPSFGLHTLTGRVATMTGAVIDEGTVKLYPSGEPGLSRTTPIRTDGTFSFSDVPDEDYTVSVEFAGQVEFVGVTPDKTGMIMRMSQPPYQSVRQDVRVTGEDPQPIVLRAKRSSGSESSAGRGSLN